MCAVVRCLATWSFHPGLSHYRYHQISRLSRSSTRIQAVGFCMQRRRHSRHMPAFTLLSLGLSWLSASCSQTISSWCQCVRVIKSWNPFLNSSFIHSGYLYSASSVHYYSEALPTHYGYCAEALQATTSEGLAQRGQGPYVSDRVGFEPTTLRSTAIDSINKPPRSTVDAQHNEKNSTSKLGLVPAYCSRHEIWSVQLHN